MTDRPETYETASETPRGTESDLVSPAGMLTAERLAELRAEVAEYRVKIQTCQKDHWHSVTCLPSEGNYLFDGCNTAEELLDAMVGPLLATLDAQATDLAELDAEFRAVDRNAAAEIKGLWERIAAADALAEAIIALDVTEYPIAMQTTNMGVVGMIGVTTESADALEAALDRYQALRQGGGGQDDA